MQQYSMEGKILDVVHEERDLGVIIQDDLKVSQQCSKVVKTANRILGMIYRSFTYKSKEVVLKLYKSLVRPHLEFCVQAWRPHLQKDIMLLEKVQRRATRMIDNFQKLSYEERLSKLKLTTLETRGLRGDLIETFNIFKGFTDVNKDYFFDLSSGSLRGHSLKLFKSRFVTNCGKFLFSNRVVDEWNLLTEDIVSCDTVNGFKNKLDRYLECCRGLT
jgi:ribonucleases P/MRP protein subunit RPP40